MKRKMNLVGLSIGLVATLASCSAYFSDFDTPVYDGVKGYSVTDLERSIVELPGDQQDKLMTVSDFDPSTCVQASTQH